MQVEATHTLEIELTITGTYESAERRTHNDPGCEARVDDLDIYDMGVVTLAKSASGTRQWKTSSILEGVDRKSEAYHRIVSNILAMIEEDATSALLEEA